MEYPQSRPAVRSDSSDTIAMIVEILFAFFGIMGMGWLYAGNIGVSVLAFIGYAILVFIEAAIVGVSFGFAACLVIPLNLAIAIVSGLRVRDYMRNSGAKGSVLYLVLGLVIGITVICGGLAMLGVLGGVLGNLQSSTLIGLS